MPRLRTTYASESLRALHVPPPTAVGQQPMEGEAAPHVLQDPAGGFWHWVEDDEDGGAESTSHAGYPESTVQEPLDRTPYASPKRPYDREVLVGHRTGAPGAYPGSMQVSLDSAGFQAVPGFARQPSGAYLPEPIVNVH